jgi:hypothetical protein
MLKKMTFAAMLAVMAAPAFAVDPFDGFAANITNDGLKPFASDMGLLMNSAINHSGRSLGFSGFDVGVRSGAILEPRSSDTGLKPSTVAEVPVVQGEIGMPFSMDGFIRGFNYNGLTIAGGGVKWGFTEVSDKPFAFRGMLYAAGHAATHKDFSLTSLAVGAVGSFQGDVIEPYFSAACTRTRLDVEDADDPTLVGASVTVVEPQFTVGFNLKPWRFAYLTLAANAVPSKIGAESSLGIRF